MDISNNLKTFNYIVLRVFDRLYESFPEPVDISGLRFVIDCVVDESGEAENTKKLHLLNDTVSWLEDEGFLKTKGQAINGDILQARLTLKGLTVLGYIPVSIDGKKSKTTIIESVKGVIRQGLIDSSTEAVKNII